MSYPPIIILIAVRLHRIEQLVKATAVDVERLAESNRFVARILADKADSLRA